MLEQPRRRGGDRERKHGSARPGNGIWYRSDQNLTIDSEAVIPCALGLLDEETVTASNDALADAEACHPGTKLGDRPGDVGAEYKGTWEGEVGCVLRLGGVSEME